MRHVCSTLPALAVLFIVAVAMAAGESVQHQTFTIVVTHGGAEAVAGAKLRVLKHNPDIRGLRLVAGIDATFDEQGRCDVDLVPGRYAFEVLSEHHPGTIVALRTKMLELRRTRKIELIASQPMPLSVMAARKPVEPEVFMIRSAATEGALTWKAKEGESSQAPSLILSPNQRYKFGVLARQENQRFAYWLTLVSQSMKIITLPSDRALHASFPWRPGGVPRDESEPAHIALFFPDTTWRIELTPDIQLVTNRRYVELAYSYPTPRGNRMYFHRHGYLLGKDTQIQIGGPITAHAYVAMHRSYHGEGYDNRLDYAAWLEDTGGHHLNHDQSKADFHSDLIRADGQPIPQNPLAAGALDPLRPLTEHFRVDVTYDLEAPVKETLVPAEPVELKTAHFVMQAVPGWEWRNRVYLLQAERAFELLKPISVYPASSQVKIGWLINKHRARGGWKGKRKGKKRGFINMPFYRYRQCVDVFAHTNFLTHEVAHTYGYPHGDAMNATVHEGERRFREFRWYAADHPEFVPDMAW